MKPCPELLPCTLSYHTTPNPHLMIMLDQLLECIDDFAEVFISDYIYVLGMNWVAIFEDGHHIVCVANIADLAVPTVNYEHNAFLLSSFSVE